jgi:hypothetical protein
MQQQQGFLLAGSVYFGAVGADPTIDLFYPAGESDKLETQPTNEVKSFTSHQEGTYGQTAAAVYLPKPTNISISLYELNRENLTKAFLGQDADMNGTAGTMSMERTLLAGQVLVFPHQMLTALQVGDAVIASTTTGVVLDNNALTWTAKGPGLSGNDITITLIDPAANNSILSITTLNKDVRVSLATDGTGLITSTASQVQTAVTAHSAASVILNVALANGSDGTGVITAVAKTNLTGGLGYEDKIDYTVNMDAGTLKPMATTRIPADEAIYIEYSHKGYNGFKISGAVNYSIETSILLRGKNLVNGQRVEFYTPRAIVAPTSPVNFLSSELLKLDLTGTLSLYEEQAPFTYKEMGVV